LARRAPKRELEQMADTKSVLTSPVVECNGARIPAAGIGTWALRGATAERIVEEALALGIRHIDTARMYDNEREIGAGIRASGVPRSEVFLTTKLLPGELRRADARRAAEDSLANLDVGYIDLLLIHWPNPAVPLAETLGVFVELKRRGAIRHIGVSNFTMGMVEQAVAVCEEPIVTNQVEFHPYLDQTQMLATCRRHGMSLTAYSPLAQGAVAHDPVIEEIAARHGKTAGQVALRWLLQHECVTVIPRSSKRERLIENASLFDFTMTDADMQRVSSLAKRDGRMTSGKYAPAWD
jgi:2,5-diketo-D-gluconate reductase B